MAQRDLKLNSLGKYGKDSSRLVLEEHGHCEVPAGCGGAVLRWRNPKTGLLFIIKVFATAKYQIFLDGDAPSSGRPLVSFGEHVISLVVTEIGPNPAVVAIAAVHDESQFGFPRVSQPSGRKIEILSAGDGTWKYTTDEPVKDAWMRTGFDDSSWSAMTTRDAPIIERKDMQFFRLQAVVKAGANCLGIDGGPVSRTWIRKTFRVDQNT